jgi:uncharacterized membrane protein YphA (DoxX/SURF4 family)
MDEAEAFEPRGRAWLRRVWRVLDGPPGPRGYWLVRFAILRLLGLVYAVAFATAVFQLVALVGEDGLLPAEVFLDRVREQYGFFELPTIFFVDCSDAMLLGVSVVGLVVAIAVMLGLENAGAMLVLWILYMSIDHVGQRWYSFGWESQLLETGFLAVFLCPLTGWRPLSRDHPPSLVVVWLMRWLSFRIMLGAGLIKLRGDACWTELTCLDYHFETQPVPSPLSWLFHFAPQWMRHGGVAFNHVVELGAPWLIVLGRRPRLVAGVLMVVFQLTLIASGNLSFLNWLTIVPCLACFDDAFLRRLLPARWIPDRDPAARPGQAVRVVSWVLAVMIAWLSIDVVLNLAGRRQSMNRSYDPLHLVNTYGAFGSVGQTRPELVIEGSNDGETWKAYEFPCKPGDPSRRPCLITPYHYRLDWLMWFAAMEAEATGRLQREAWVLQLVHHLLRADPETLGLLAHDPFDGKPPALVRVRLFQYRFAPPGAEDWWTREEVGTLIRPVAVDDAALQSALDELGLIERS